MKTVTLILKSRLYSVPLLFLCYMNSAIAEESQTANASSTSVQAQSMADDKIKDLQKQSKAKSPPLEIKSNSALITTKK